MAANDLASAIHREGAARYPEEACGVVIRRGNKPVVLPCRNVAENPRAHFMLSMDDYVAAAKFGEVIGIWHTHVEIPPKPSEADRVGCENTEMPWYIASVYKTQDGFAFSDVEVVNPCGFEMPYLERPYVFGVLDCYSLLRDFYKREYGIRLTEAPRVERFWSKKLDFIGQGWKERGFVQMIDQEPQVGDVFLIQTTTDNIPNHIAIYVGDEMIMHHCHGRLSRRDIYGGHWQKHTVYHLRHQSKC